MDTTLDTDALVALIQRVFSPGPDDRALAILVDLPDQAVPDTPSWRERRDMALGWWSQLADASDPLAWMARDYPSRCLTWWSQLTDASDHVPLETVSLVFFRNTHANNADLPPTATLFVGGEPPHDADSMTGPEVPFDDLFRRHSILLAPTPSSPSLRLSSAPHPSTGFAPPPCPASPGP